MDNSDHDRNYDALMTTDIIKSDKFKFVWKVSDFNDRPEKNKEYLRSEEFTIKGPGDKVSKWFVELYPKGLNEVDKNHISVFLFNNTKEDIYAKYVMSTNANKSEQIMSLKRFCKDGKENNWGWSQAYTQDEIKLQPPHDTFILTLEITIFGESKKSIEILERGSMSFALSSNYHLQQLAQDFDSLFNSKQQTDVSVKCGEKMFNCHQNIVASRSQVFKMMFESNMKEKLTGSVEVKNMDHRVFEDMLKYIYSGQAPNIDDHTEELFAAADQYQLEKLKEMCELKLCLKLEVPNCIDLLVLGHLYHASTLKTAALKFVSKNITQIDTCKWEPKLVAYPTLLAEVFKMMLPTANDGNAEVKKRSALT